MPLPAQRQFGAVLDVSMVFSLPQRNLTLGQLARSWGGRRSEADQRLVFIMLKNCAVAPKFGSDCNFLMSQPRFGALAWGLFISSRMAIAAAFGSLACQIGRPTTM